MKRSYRSVWISDLHLGTRDCRSHAVQALLDSIECEHLYLVGDIIDVWALKQKWYWPRHYNEILHTLLQQARAGAQVTFIPGNHDEYFRDFLGYPFGDIEIASHAYHDTADGRRFFVTHGDQYDGVVCYHRWLSRLGSLGYRYLVMLNRLTNAIRRKFGKPYWSLSGTIKRKVKRAVSYLTNFEEVLSKEARLRNVDGVICGHVHQPAARKIDGILYYNTGDWIENCTALVEHESGELEILHWRPEFGESGTHLPDATEMVPNLDALLEEAARLRLR
jgi:UDP-2,3-diacylglucosamine pyrophosphatase LpxH